MTALWNTKGRAACGTIRLRSCRTWLTVAPWHGKNCSIAANSSRSPWVAGNRGGDRIELATYAGRCIRLHVVRVEMARSAVIEDENARANRGLRHDRGLFRAELFEWQAPERQSARLQEMPAGAMVAIGCETLFMDVRHGSVSPLAWLTSAPKWDRRDRPHEAGPADLSRPASAAAPALRRSWRPCSRASVDRTLDNRRSHRIHQ